MCWVNPMVYNMSLMFWVNPVVHNMSLMTWAEPVVHYLSLIFWVNPVVHNMSLMFWVDPVVHNMSLMFWVNPVRERSRQQKLAQLELKSEANVHETFHNHSRNLDSNQKQQPPPIPRQNTRTKSNILAYRYPTSLGVRPAKILA